MGTFWSTVNKTHASLLNSFYICLIFKLLKSYLTFIGAVNYGDRGHLQTTEEPGTEYVTRTPRPPNAESELKRGDSFAPTRMGTNQRHVIGRTDGREDCAGSEGTA